MTTMTYRGVVHGRTVLLAESAAGLPDGTEVLVTPAQRRPDTTVALLAAVQAEPHLTGEDMDEFEKSIAAGHRPLSPPPTWADDPIDGGDK